MIEELGVKSGDVTAVRCVWCEARLFDTDGRIGEPETRQIEVTITCWRCKGMNVICLAINGKHGDR